MIHLEQAQKGGPFALDVLLEDSVERVKKKEIRKDNRKLLPIPCPLGCGNPVPVEPHFSLLRSIQSGEHLDECGLPAAIAADHEHDFTRRQLEIHRSEAKMFSLPALLIRKGDGFECEHRFTGNASGVVTLRILFRVNRAERNAELL